MKKNTAKNKPRKFIITALCVACKAELSFSHDQAKEFPQGRKRHHTALCEPCHDFYNEIKLDLDNRDDTREIQFEAIAPALRDWQEFVDEYYAKEFDYDLYDGPTEQIEFYFKHWQFGE